MKAIVNHKYGPPSLLKLQEVEKPVPKADEVLIKTYATAINDWDWSFARGKPYMLRLMYGLRKPKVNILGAEVAGVVEAVGENAKKFWLGDEVYCDTSENGLGGFAEYVCVRENDLVHKPAAMSFEEAAAIPHAAMLALQGLVDKGQIQQGQKLLINGAGGGVGTFGVQLAKLYGAEVTGVDSSDKLDMLREMGFDHVIDYKSEDFTKNGKRYDLVLDTKTTRSPFAHLRSLNPGGIYVTVGGALPRLFQMFVFGPLIARFTKKKTLILSLKANKDLAYINELFEAGKIKCVLDGPYPLAEVPTAVQRFGEGKHKGKIVIRVEHKEIP